MPRRRASSTSSAAEKVPSEAVVWECRSIIVFQAWFFRRGCSGVRDQTEALECTPYLLGALRGRFRRGMNRQLGRYGTFVRIGNPSEVTDFAGEGFLVKALHVALNQHVQGTLHIDLYK